MLIKSAADWSKPKNELQAMKRLAELGGRLRSVEELDRVLDQDAKMTEDPILRAETKQAIQTACPHLRSM